MRQAFNETRRKILKVAKIKDANYGCKDEGDDDGRVDDNGGTGTVSKSGRFGSLGLLFNLQLLSQFLTKSQW